MPAYSSSSHIAYAASEYPIDILCTMKKSFFFMYIAVSQKQNIHGWYENAQRRDIKRVRNYSYKYIRPPSDRTHKEGTWITKKTSNEEQANCEDEEIVVKYQHPLGISLGTHWKCFVSCRSGAKMYICAPRVRYRRFVVHSVCLCVHRKIMESCERIVNVSVAWRFSIYVEKGSETTELAK